MNINVIDKCGIIKDIKTKVISDDTKEYCAMAVCDSQIHETTMTFSIFDASWVDDFGGTSTEFSITVPANLSHALLNICRKNHFLPFIVHTHSPKVSIDHSVFFL